MRSVPAKAKSPRRPLTESSRSHGRKLLLPLVALWACALAAYSNSFRTGLPFDNAWVIQQDARIQAVTLENLRLIFTKDYAYQSSTSGLYRPLTTLSYLVNYSILGNGSDPAGYHWANLLLHAINVALVYLLGLLLFREFQARVPIAFAVAALWGLHPVLTESVTNVVGRADLLAGFGVLAGLLCHVQSVAASGRARMKWVITFVCVTAIGIFSKENAISVAAVMFLYDWLLRGGWNGPREWWRACWPSYIALILPLATYFLLREHALGQTVAPAVPFTDNPLMGAGFWLGRLTAIKVIGKYLWLLVWPLTLSCDYSFNQIPLASGRFTTVEDWKALIALAVCLSLAALAIWCYRRQKTVCFFLAFFFVTLAPTANVFLLIGTIMAERFLYVPSIAFAGCLVWLLHAAARRRPSMKQAGWVAAAIVCLAYAGRTYARNFDWQDDRTLWTSAAAASPASYKTQIHLATAIAEPNGEGIDEAIRAVNRALTILGPVADGRNVPQAYSIAGFFYRSRGDLLATRGPNAVSQEWYRKALDALLRGQRVDQTISREVRAENAARGIRTNAVGWYPLYLELGETYLRLSDPRQALGAFEYGRAIHPAPEFFEDGARADLMAGDRRAAAMELLKGFAADANAPKVAAELTDLYRQDDPHGCAVTSGNGRAGLNVRCPEVHDALCAAASNDVQFYTENSQSGVAATVRARAREFGCPAASP